MNDDLAVGTIAMDDGEYKIMTGAGLTTIGSVGAIANGGILTANTLNTVTIRANFNVEDFLDTHIMNRVTVDHKVQEQELMKLRETAPDYANEIKENIAKECSRDMVKKLTFTKKHDKNADVHHFIGRVWMFTEDELKNLINEARNV